MITSGVGIDPTKNKTSSHHIKPEFKTWIILHTTSEALESNI